jgi:DNA-binding beta-propeller fold protein YncE
MTLAMFFHPTNDWQKMLKAGHGTTIACCLFFHIAWSVSICHCLGAPPDGRTEDQPGGSLAEQPGGSLAEKPESHSIFAGNGTSPAPNRQPPNAGQRSGSTNVLSLGNPFGVEIAGTEVAGDSVWITTVDDHCIWQTDLNRQRIRRVAGNGQSGYSGDGGHATSATMNWPHEVRVDKAGNLYVADTRNHVIRRIDAATQKISTIAGCGKSGFSGDGETGSRVRFNQPHSIVLDGQQGLLVADTKNHRIRRIDLETHIVTTVAGTGEKKLPVDGAVATQSPLFGPRSLAVDDESIWVALREGNSIWRIDREKRTIHHIAGTGEKGYSGDGGPALQATFSGPKGIAIDQHGNLLIVDTENHAIRRIDVTTNRIDTILGGNQSETTMRLKRPHGIAISRATILVGDSEHHRVVQTKSSTGN